MCACVFNRKYWLLLKCSDTWFKLVLRNFSEISLKLRIFSNVQKMKFSIKDIFGKCDQIRRNLRIWQLLFKKSLMENFIFVQCTPVPTPNIKAMSLDTRYDGLTISSRMKKLTLHEKCPNTEFFLKKFNTVIYIHYQG